MFGSFFFALAGLVFFGVIFHALNWGFTLTDRGLKQYAVIFAVIVLVIAAAALSLGLMAFWGLFSW